MFRPGLCFECERETSSGVVARLGGWCHDLLPLSHLFVKAESGLSLWRNSCNDSEIHRLVVQVHRLMSPFAR